MGKVTDGLYALLEMNPFQFTQKQGKDDRRRKTKEEFVKTDDEGIEKDFPETGGGKDCAEMFQAHPGAAAYTQTEVEIPEGDLYSVHGPVSEDNIVYQPWKQKEHHLLVLPVAGQYTVFFEE
jgi:hypothetical protein